MPNYYYFDKNNQKQGAITEEQLKELAAQGLITPHTPMETDTGHKGVAGQIPGLFPTTAPATAPAIAPAPAPTPVSSDHALKMQQITAVGHLLTVTMNEQARFLQNEYKPEMRVLEKKIQENETQAERLKRQTKVSVLGLGGCATAAAFVFGGLCAFISLCLLVFEGGEPTVKIIFLCLGIIGIFIGISHTRHNSKKKKLGQDGIGVLTKEKDNLAKKMGELNKRKKDFEVKIAELENKMTAP